MKKLNIIAMLFVISTQTFSAENVNMSDEARNTNVYTQIPAEITQKNTADSKTIRYYFSFTCGYCKLVKDFISVWGKSLPNNLTYTATPVVDKTEASRMLAVAYYYVLEKAPNDYYLDKYTNNIFTHIHKISTSEELSRLIKESMVDAKVNFSSFVATISGKQFLEKVNKLKDQQEQYDISVTPTVVIGATYLTHLGLAEGDPSRFIEILNAIVNLHLYTSSGLK